MTKVNKHVIIVIIQNLIVTLVSGIPNISKWWCIGAILNTLLPNVLKCQTWIITDKASKININPAIGKSNSCFKNITIIPNIPPKVSYPVSTINTRAGEKLNQRNPVKAPIIDAK